MPAGGARRGRRDNGLVAREYAVVGDVDPRIGEHLLDVLAAGGVAAYLQPATDLHPVTRTTTLPARPTDRLYADREHLGTAREYLAQLATDNAAVDPARESAPRQTDGPDQEQPRPRPDPAAAPADPTRPAEGRSRIDDEEAWASIVAGYDITIDPTAPPWPEAEEVNTPATRAPDMDTEPAPRTTGLRRAEEQISLLDGLDTFGADLPDDEDGVEGYTPPPPPPLPRISAPAIVALLSIAVGLLLFFWPNVLPVSQTWTLFLAFGAVLAGFVALIWRLRPGDEEDDPDDGARV